MKLLRYGSAKHEKPGLLDSDGAIRDLSQHIDDISPETVIPKTLSRLAELKIDELPIVSGNPRLGLPIKGIGKFIQIDLTYANPAKEAGLRIPAEPPMFTKAISCLSGPNDDVMLPRDSLKSDWEVELGVVIGRTTRYVAKEKALDSVAGYVLANDISERAFQMERGATWDKGKGCDTFGPVGPWLVTADEVGDPQDLAMWLDVNGVRRQTGNTRTMVFPVGKLVSYVSEFMTLEPGDLITTGTP